MLPSPRLTYHRVLNMTTSPIPPSPGGLPEMAISDELRNGLFEHFEILRRLYEDQRWAGRVGFGSRPAVVVVDLALGWTLLEGSLGYDMDTVVEATVQVLDAARGAGAPIFFTTGSEDHVDPGRKGANKFLYPSRIERDREFTLDPRLERRPDEKLIAKPYDSSFKDTNLGAQLHNLGVDTLVVTGCSTSHCVRATCADALDEYRVIVPREAVGDGSELLHEVTLFNIDIRMGDVMPVAEVIAELEKTTSDLR